MTFQHEYRGKIKDWEKVVTDSGIIVIGTLEENRYFSGMKVHTKTIQEWHPHKDGTATIVTKNARYLLEKK